MERVVTSTEFEATCLRLVDEVARTGEPVTVTRNGSPVARLVPAASASRPLFGCMKGTMVLLGDLDEPVDVAWDART